MRVVELKGAFGLQSLALGERPSLRPGQRQVRVRLRAASLNYRDLLMVRGEYNPKQGLPLIPLSDGAGEVVELGVGAARFRVGDRVCAAFLQSWVAGEPSRDKLRGSLGGPLDGMLAEEAVFHEEGLVQAPDHLSFEEAATLPCAAVTAWSALMQGAVKPGDTVLVQGTGGVSVFALQLSRLLGARVIVTSSSDEKLERARGLGASDGINYRTEPEWGRRARELTSGAGVDHVIEVGGAGTLPQSLKCVRPGGQISVIGVLAGSGGALSLLPVLMQNVRLQGVLVGSRERFEELNRAVTLHQLRPVVDRVFPLEETRAAFEHMQAGAHFGKIVIRL